MHDIIIDDRRPSGSQQKSKIVVKKGKKKRGLSLYLVDWVEKSIIIAAFLAINFLLFINAGSYNFFSSGYSISIEALYILVGIGILSVLLMYLVSFSSFLQNLIATTIFIIFVLAMFNQFALFDKDAMLTVIIRNYFGDLGDIFIKNSHFAFTLIVGLFFFIFLATSTRITLGYFIGILLVILAGISSDAYFNKNNKSSFRNTYNRNVINNVENGKKFVYITMPELTSYYNMKDFIDPKAGNEAYNNEINKALNSMLGFYAKNNFTMYPFAYVNSYDKYKNITQVLNPDSQDPQENTLNNVILSSYWSFKDLDNQYIYLQDNKIFDTFKKAKYDIKAYQSRGIELCSKNNEISVSKCVKKNNTPISMKDIEASTKEKTMLLLAQWLESSELIKNWSLPYSLLKPFFDVNKVPPLGFSTKGLYVIDSIKTIDKAAEDILKDNGNNAYFLYLDIPADMYIYDEFCQIKPIQEWSAKNPLPWILRNETYKKRIAYSQQISCIYGKLEEFMNKLKENNLDKNTVVVIQGANGLNGLNEKIEKEFIFQFKNEKVVNVAIRDPLKGSYESNYDICSAPAILRQYLFKKYKCVEMEEFQLHQTPKKELLDNIHKFNIPEADVKNAQEYFEKWYQNWLKVQTNPNEVIEPVEIIQETVQAEEVNVGTIKTIDKPIDVAAEDEIKDFTKAINEQEVFSDIKGIDEEQKKEDTSSDDKTANINVKIIKVQDQVPTPKTEPKIPRKVEPKKTQAEETKVQALPEVELQPRQEAEPKKTTEQQPTELINFSNEDNIVLDEINL